MKRIKNRLDAVQNKTVVPRMGDKFESAMRPFHGASNDRVGGLIAQKDSVFADLKELGIWLNEPKDVHFKYLKTLNEFRMNFVRSIKSVEQRKQRMAEIEKRRKWAAAKKKKKEESAVKKKSAAKRRRSSVDMKEEERVQPETRENVVKSSDSGKNVVTGRDVEGKQVCCGTMNIYCF